MFTQQIVKEYQEKYPHEEFGFHKWNNTILYEWEYQLLLDNNAISPKGILQNYPVLKVIKSNGDCYYQDLDGDLNYIQNKINDINNAGTQQRAKVDYACKNYDEWIEFKKGKNRQEQKQEYAIEMSASNTVDISKLEI